MHAPARPIQRGILALIFFGAGVAHFLRPEPYIGIVPPSLPSPAVLVLISGLAELLGAIGILVAVTRRVAGAGLILLLIAVFPANAYMLSLAVDNHQPHWWIALLILRLPLQPLLIWWVWRAAVAPERPDAT